MLVLCSKHITFKVMSNEMYVHNRYLRKRKRANIPVPMEIGFSAAAVRAASAVKQTNTSRHNRVPNVFV